MKKELKKIASITLFSFASSFIFTPANADSVSRRIVNEHIDRTDRNIDLFGRTGTPAVIDSASNGFVKVMAGIVLLMTGVALFRYLSSPTQPAASYESNPPQRRQYNNSRYYENYEEEENDNYNPPPPPKKRQIRRYEEPRGNKSTF